MLLFITFVVLVLVCLILLRVIRNGRWRDEWPEFLTGCIAVFSAIGAVACPICWICCKSEIKEFQTKYDYVLEMVENYSENSDGTGYAISETVIEINKEILEHRVYDKNIWVGMFYFKDVAEFKLIPLPSRPLKELKE